jgi:hypothetical protein
MNDGLELAFLRCGCGWPAETLDEPDRPPLAAQLAEAFAHVRHVWEAATPEEREGFWSWLVPEAAKPSRQRHSAVL